MVSAASVRGADEPGRRQLPADEGELARGVDPVAVEHRGRVRADRRGGRRQLDPELGQPLRDAHVRPWAA